jgi:hypothetical protein
MNQVIPIIRAETGDSRKRPYNGAPTYHLTYNHAGAAYSRSVTPPKRTDALPIGTQQRFLDAAAAAAMAGSALNVMLTICWDRLFSSNEALPLRCMSPKQRIDHIVELMRHWLRWREIPAFYIWVREALPNEGEHWHIIFHLPPKYHRNFEHMVAAWTGEAKKGGRRSPHVATKGEFACGECGSWHLARDTAQKSDGRLLAAYLGKGEPSQRMFRGKLVDNTFKPVRGRSFGGTQRDGKYDAAQGLIEGATHREDRFFISKHLQDLARRQCTG